MGLDAKLAAIPDADVRIHAVLGLYSLNYWNGGVMNERIITETLTRPETAVFGLKLHCAREETLARSTPQETTIL